MKYWFRSEFVRKNRQFYTFSTVGGGLSIGKLKESQNPFKFNLFYTLFGAPSSHFKYRRKNFLSSSWEAFAGGFSDRFFNTYTYKDKETEKFITIYPRIPLSTKLALRWLFGVRNFAINEFFFFNSDFTYFADINTRRAARFLPRLNYFYDYFFVQQSKKWREFNGFNFVGLLGGGGTVKSALMFSNFSSFGFVARSLAHVNYGFWGNQEFGHKLFITKDINRFPFFYDEEVERKLYKAGKFSFNLEDNNDVMSHYEVEENFWQLSLFNNFFFANESSSTITFKQSYDKPFGLSSNFFLAGNGGFLNFVILNNFCCNNEKANLNFYPPVATMLKEFFGDSTTFGNFFLFRNSFLINTKLNLTKSYVSLSGFLQTIQGNFSFLKFLSLYVFGTGKFLDAFFVFKPYVFLQIFFLPEHSGVCSFSRCIRFTEKVIFFFNDFRFFLLSKFQQFCNIKLFIFEQSFKSNFFWLNFLLDNFGNPTLVQCAGAGSRSIFAAAEFFVNHFINNFFFFNSSNAVGLVKHLNIEFFLLYFKFFFKVLSLEQVKFRRIKLLVTGGEWLYVIYVKKNEGKLFLLKRLFFNLTLPVTPSLIFLKISNSQLYLILSCIAKLPNFINLFDVGANFFDSKLSRVKFYRFWFFYGYSFFEMFFRFFFASVTNLHSLEGVELKRSFDFFNSSNLSNFYPTFMFFGGVFFVYKFIFDNSSTLTFNKQKLLHKFFIFFKNFSLDIFYKIKYIFFDFLIYNFFLYTGSNYFVKKLYRSVLYEFFGVQQLLVSNKSYKGLGNFSTKSWGYSKLLDFCFNSTVNNYARNNFFFGKGFFLGRHNDILHFAKTGCLKDHADVFFFLDFIGWERGRRMFLRLHSDVDFNNYSQGSPVSFIFDDFFFDRLSDVFWTFDSLNAFEFDDSLGLGQFSKNLSYCDQAFYPVLVGGSPYGALFLNRFDYFLFLDVSSLSGCRMPLGFVGSFVYNDNLFLTASAVAVKDLHCCTTLIFVVSKKFVF